MTCSATASVLGRFETTWSTTCCLLGRFETTWKQRDNWCRLKTARNFFWKYIQQITCNEIECQQQELRDLYRSCPNRRQSQMNRCENYCWFWLTWLPTVPAALLPPDIAESTFDEMFFVATICRMDFWIIYSQPGLGADWLYRFQPQPLVWKSIWSKLIFFWTHLASS